jgi:hypothetical protein
VWRWGDVNAWLAGIGEGDEDVHVPTREEALQIEYLLPHWRLTLDDGLPLVNAVPAVEGGEYECRMGREAVRKLLEGTLALPGILESISAFPRLEQQRLTVVCAVLTDRLDSVVRRIGHDETWAVLAFKGPKGELHLRPIGTREAPGAVPASQLGLGPDATVGDLLLVQTNGPGALSPP